MATLKTGVWLAVAICAAGVAYFLLTWEQGNRPALLAITVVGAALDVGVLLLPMKRVVAGRWRELFFLSWTLANVVFILVLGALDPTEPSPVTLPLLMPMLFAGMSYPRVSARICAAAVVFGYIAEALILGHDFAYSAFFVMVLACTAGMCLWQAHNRELQHDELEHQRDELSRISLTDPLTEALNRRGFEDRLGRELADAVRSGRPLTLAVLDLDDFKAVNDREGHGAGDALLREAVKRLSAILRPRDALGRLGGDEFAVLFPGAGETEAPALVARLRGAIAGHVSASFGHSCFPADGDTSETLSGQADRRLYAAKAMLPRNRGSEAQVAEYAAAIARGLGWEEPALGRLRLAATLQTVGAEVLAPIVGLEEIAVWVRHSHEHVDGSGHPDALAADAIPLASRILLVADAFDAMTAGRPYRPARTVELALAELRRHAGTQFDADCVAALIAGLRAPDPVAA